MRIDKLPYIKTVAKLSLIYKIELLFSFIFTCILTSGYLLSTYDKVDVTPFSNQKIFTYILGSLVTWCVVFFCLTVIRRWSLNKPKVSAAIPFLQNLSDNKLWLLASVAIFACYLPIIMSSLSMLSPDSWNSIGQVVGEAPLNNANPLIFTAFVGVFISIGRLFGSIELGTVLFSLAQSAILSVIFARVIVWMRQQKIGKTAIIATFLFYAILPINSIAGLIMWKDILFAGFGLLFLMMLRRLYIEKNLFFSPKSITYFIVLAFLFCNWRNNGLYAYGLFVILAVIVNRKTLFNKKCILLLFSPIVATLLYLVIISSVVVPSSSQHALAGIPSQQVARSVKYGSGSISQADKKAINEILPYDQLDDKYNPRLSDPVMATFNDEVFGKNEEKYFIVWLRLLESHTKTFVAAFLYNNYGYTYPFYISSTPTDVLLNNANHPNALKGYTDNAYIDGGKFLTADYRDLTMKTVPLLHNIGFYTCVLLLAMYVAIIRKRRELAGVFLILLTLFISTVIGPVNSEFRYLYLFVVATPFVIGAVFCDFRIKKGNEKHA